MGRTLEGFAMVRAIAASLPGVEEGTSWGVPSIKLRGRLLTCMASHKSAEPNTLVVRIGFEQRDAMIADDPGTYYLKDHYVGYACVLVRLSRIRPDALKDLLHAGWRLVDATARARRPAAPRRTTPRPTKSRPRSGSRSRRT